MLEYEQRYGYKSKTDATKARTKGNAKKHPTKPTAMKRVFISKSFQIAMTSNGSACILFSLGVGTLHL